MEDVGNPIYILPGSDSSASGVCIAANPLDFKVNSFGYFAGESPFEYTFPVLLLQIFIRMFISRCLYYLLRPFKQPRIVADIIGCILTSPAILGPFKLGTGKNKNGEEASLYTLIFPDMEHGAIIRTLGDTGLMFYFFLIAVQIEPAMIIRSGKKAWVIGICSLVIPFAVVSSLLLLLRKDVRSGIAHSRFILTVSGMVTITSFAVLADVLAELQLLSSELGRLALAASMVQGVFVLALDVIFVAVIQGQEKWEYSVFALLSLASFVTAIVFVFRPWALRIARRTPRTGRIEERYIFGILLLVLMLGLVSDLIGANYSLLPIIMGLALPVGPPLGSAVIDNTQLLINEVLMPLMFFLAGHHIKVSNEFQTYVWILLAVVFVGYVAKVIGTMIPAMYYHISIRDSFLLGLIMNFRGMVEMINFHNFFIVGLLDGEAYLMMLVAVIAATGVAAPIVTVLYKPTTCRHRIGRRSIQHLKAHTELCILACVNNDSPVPSIINLIEASCPYEDTPLCIYILHLVELAGQAHSSLTAHKDKRGFINPSGMDPLHNAFTNFQQQKRGYGIEVQPFTSVSPSRTMYQDICTLASDKNVSLIVVPFRRLRSSVMNEDVAIQSNIPEILAQAPCSVGILIYADDMAPVTIYPDNFQYHIGILFWGGPDDREALSYASRMAGHSGITLTVIHFIQPVDRRDMKQRQLDDILLSRVRFENINNKHITVDEVMARDIEETITVIKSLSNRYNLIMVGHRQGENSLLEEGLGDWSERQELGVVGDLLASKDFETSATVLVVQQQTS